MFERNSLKGVFPVTNSFMSLFHELLPSFRR